MTGRVSWAGSASSVTADGRALRARSCPPTLRRTKAKIAPVALLGTKTYKNYIAGEWVAAESGDTFESTSPANGETLGTFPKSSPADIDRAVEAAKEAYEDWRLTPAPKRGEIPFRLC